MVEFKYKRALLKLSGEALAGKNGESFDISLMDEISLEICKLAKEGLEIAVVIGGGNIIRGASQQWMNRENADYMGMTATVINSMALAEVLRKNNLNAKVFSAVPMELVCETYNPSVADEHLKNGEIVVLGGGTGKPYVTTDTTATLRAKELNCDCVLKATKVDGIYDEDPVKNPNAKKFSNLSFDEALERNLKVMDEKAFLMAKENNISIIVFNIFEKDNIVKVLQGENVGTIVS